ncbi:hypothetical protein FKW77_007867 [Venturia effusa]|uniref:Uncharacterized protein n=1 Tax=Venturia effusa TaxID=50376 RepID=A0A517KZU8_9PEZI|nr:hypothetical protein FKW77_007867 [Venturia effusa]
MNADMIYAHLYQDDNLPPGSERRSASDGYLRHQKRMKRQLHFALPAPGTPPAGSSSINNPLQQPAKSESPLKPHSFFSILPREVRNLIYQNLALLYNLEDHSFFIGNVLIGRTPILSPLLPIATSLTFPLVLLSKQFLLEYVEELFLSGTVRLVGGPRRVYEFLHGQQRQMRKLHHIEFQWESMPTNLIEDLHYVTTNEIRPLLDFLRLSTQVSSITIPLYFMERSGTNLLGRLQYRRPEETRLAREKRRLIPFFWMKFIFHALQILMMPNSGFEEIVIRYHPYDMWTCMDQEVGAQNLLGKKPSEWAHVEFPLLHILKMETEDDPTMVGLDEMFAGTSIRERDGAEIGVEALIRFRKPRS